MSNFDFKRTNRKCCISERAFQPGEEFISFLIEQDGELVRQDAAVEQWNESPQECVGWWKSRVPDLEQGCVYWAPKDVLLAYFSHLIERNNDQDTLYVMAILLVQKKYLRLLDTVNSDDGQTMELLSPTSNERFAVAVTTVEPARVKTIEAELNEKLFTDIDPFSQ